MMLPSMAVCFDRALKSPMGCHIKFYFHSSELKAVRLKDTKIDTQQNTLTKIYIKKRLEGFMLERIDNFNNTGFGILMN